MVLPKSCVPTALHRLHFAVVLRAGRLQGAAHRRAYKPISQVTRSDQTGCLPRHNVAAIRAAAETWASAVPPGQLQASPASCSLTTYWTYLRVSVRLKLLLLPQARNATTILDLRN